jgi:phosphate transport system substrate-binding protein
LAADVSLQLKDGGFTISGELLSYDGKNYVVDSSTLGTMMVSAEKFSCVKGACPDEVKVPQPASTDDSVLRIAGSVSIGYQFLPSLIKKYAASKSVTVEEIGEGTTEEIELRDSEGKPFQTIKLKRDGSSSAFTALEAGEADIGASTRSISDAEIGDLARAGHFGMNSVGRQHVLGLDGLVVIVSGQNPISALSLEDVSRIFSGEVTDWSEFGQEARPINVHARNADTGTFGTFKSLVLAPFKRQLTGQAISHDTNLEVAKAVADDPGGIGFSGFSEAGAAKPIGLKDTCGITHRPTRFSVKSGEYPLSRELHFYTTKITQPSIADFVGFAVSPNGQEVLEEAGFISRRITTTLFDQFSDRVVSSVIARSEDFDLVLMRQLILDLMPGVRLSSTIRFEQGGDTKINSESAQQFSAIIDHIAKQDLTSNQILLAGFSDSTGAFPYNLAVSLKRANAVRDALLVPGQSALQKEDVIVKGYGELFPVACNDIEAGRSKNRRVEMWLVPRRGLPIILNRQP